ncbi:MAG: hypothetical protein HY741_28535 [Chloroflexi bacterium]|nr:hypothetical protein [Chloroflexota bacterium]
MIPLDKTLDHIVDAQLLRRSNDAEPAYVFRHTLVQEIASASLLKQQRQELHRRVGETLEALYPQQRDELAPRLALHFAEAKDDAKTVEYSLAAGDAAMRVYANAEALMFYDRALAPARRVATLEQIRHLYARRGRALELLARYPEAILNYNALRALAQERALPALELAAMLPLATLFATPNPAQDLTQAAQLNTAALTLARTLNDRAAQVQVLWNMMLENYFRGDLQTAQACGEQALEIARADNLRERLAFVLNDLSRVYFSLGPAARALALLEEARRLWLELDNLPMLADNLATIGETLVTCGEYDRALPYAQEAQRIGERIGNYWSQTYSHFTMLPIAADRGEISTALALADEMVRLSDASGFTIARGMAIGIKAQILARMGNFQAARLEIQARPRFDTQTGSALETWMSALRCMIEIARGDLEAAAAELQQAYLTFNAKDFTSPAPILVPLAEGQLALAEQRAADAIAALREPIQKLGEIGVLQFLPDALLVMGRAQLTQADRETARETFLQARALTQKMTLRRLEWEINAELWALENASGNFDAARTYRENARATISFIAEHSTPSLRASFINLPGVRAVLDEDAA